MKILSLPTAPVTSAADLRQHFAKDDSLPTTEDEAKKIIEMAPEGWQLAGTQVVFPRVVSRGMSEGGGADEVESPSILSFIWLDDRMGEWKAKWLIAGPKRWGGSPNGSEPDHVNPRLGQVIIPQRAA